MADPTVVFITGASRGIGKALAETYLLRPNHTVIASVRNLSSPSAQALESLSAATGSRLLLAKIENTNPTDPAEAIKQLQDAGIDHIDVAIANAGGTSGRILKPVETVPPKDILDLFEINAMGPLYFYQAVLPLLLKSTKTPKFVSVSSAAGSMGNMEMWGANRATAYGLAKTGLNWITLAAHCGTKELVAFALHPGLVQTELGSKSAREMGLEDAPTTVKESIDAILALVDAATREKTSGKFYDAISGEELPW
ncbi:NAD(P)-binding protein [Podospora aff. communis PSN243]|uniref:NAD(P)-binding protein n=1 Tax=Podospora aff. communis PSN243 TaxID=3040156 RepID=A0AAV9GEN6_9PEZI|nr:NAD(P)-binding protein [Podospora aff. communis PSN243]